MMLVRPLPLLVLTAGSSSLMHLDALSATRRSFASHRWWKGDSSMMPRQLGSSSSPSWHLSLLSNSINDVGCFAVRTPRQKSQQPPRHARPAVTATTIARHISTATSALGSHVIDCRNDNEEPLNHELNPYSLHQEAHSELRLYDDDSIYSDEAFTPRIDDETQDFVADIDDSLLDAAVVSNQFTASPSVVNTTNVTTMYDDGAIFKLMREQPDQTLPNALLHFPRHASNPEANQILQATEQIVRQLHQQSKSGIDLAAVQAAKEAGRDHEVIYANNYVDLGKIDTVGFDFDYTLATYTDELLKLIYEKALNRLVKERQYPLEMLDAGLKYDPYFSIRGLAVDKETGWITHLSYTHKVAKAWEGRERVPAARVFQEYRGKRALRPQERRTRLKPLNDLFSMAECCLIADTIQFFKDRAIPYSARNVVTDVLEAIANTHLSFEFHKLVAQHPEVYFEAKPHLKQVLRVLKQSGKRLIFVSNTPFWYVDAGMRYIFGAPWIDEFDAVITSGGKPSFYTDNSRPFREVCQETRRIMFKEVETLERGKVYAEGCLKELVRLMDWNAPSTTVPSTSTSYGSTKPSQQDPRPHQYSDNDEDDDDDDDDFENSGAYHITSGSHEVATSNVLYIGDSLFTDLVDAKREFGWTTAAVAPEVGYEMVIQKQADFSLSQRTMDIILHAARTVQTKMGIGVYSEDDKIVLDALERLVSLWRDRETALLGSPFGSVFRARYQPSLFSHSLRRYCDLYMTSVSSLRHYSCQHRFYPQSAHRLLAHEVQFNPETHEIATNPMAQLLDGALAQYDEGDD